MGKTGKGGAAHKNTKRDPVLLRRLRLRDASYEVHEWIALALLLGMALQPLQGIISQAYTAQEIVGIFVARRDLIRALGYASLLNALVFYGRRLLTEGTGILKITFLKRPWNTCLLLLLFWSFICTGHAAEQEVAIGGDAIRFEGILSYIAYAGFFAGAGVLRDKQKKRALLIAMGAAATLLAGLSIWCYYRPSATFLVYMNDGIIGGLSGTFVNTNHYGYYLAIMAVLLFSLAVLTDTAWRKAIAILLGAFQFGVLIINNTMGSVIAALMGTLLLLILLAVRKGGKTKRAMLISLCALVLCAAGALAFCLRNPESNQFTRDVARMVQDVKDIATGAEGVEAAGSDRWGAWKASVEIIRQHPWMGCGTDNAFYAMEPVYGIQKMPHNEYLEHAVNMGLPALILYLGALLSILVNRLCRLKKLTDTEVIAACVAFTYAVSAFFGVTLNTVLPFFYIFLALCANGWEEAQPAQ